MAKDGCEDKDCFYVEFFVPGPFELRSLIDEAPMDIIHIHPNKDDDVLVVNALLDEKYIERIKKRGWKVDVGANQSQIGRERQKEVGKGDRFDGGKVAPRGLARKGESS